ncbi:MAG: CopD family protein [Chloroflexi bacterium]|nr:CopD family protein [Chloroflexota bacterium]
MAVLLIGGSLFFRQILIPESYRFAGSEMERSRIINRVAKRFGAVDWWVIAILVGSGLYLLSQRISSPADLFEAHRGYVLIKVIVVGVLLTLIILHNRVFGRRIVRYVDQCETAKLQRLRKCTRWIALSNLGLTGAVMLVSVRL